MQCTKCKKVKLACEFATDQSRKEGVRRDCKACNNISQKNRYQSKKKANMSELISSKQIGEEFKLADALVISYLEVAKIPAHKLVVGIEAMSLYDKAAAFKAVEARVKEEKAIAEANLARLEAARIPTIKDVMAALKDQAAVVKTLAADVADVADLQDEIKRLVLANQSIFKALTEFKTDTCERLAGLKTLVVNMRDEVKSAPRDAASASALEKVAVVGISTTHHASLSAEFADLVNLKLLDASDMRGIYGLRGYNKVFLMKKYTDYKHAEQLKAVKIMPEPITGSIEDLRDKLTAYCLNVV